MSNRPDLSWMKERVNDIKGHSFLYKFMCFFSFRLKKKLTYEELFLIYYGINKKSMGEYKSKEKALDTIIKIYMDNNGKKPYGV